MLTRCSACGRETPADSAICPFCNTPLDVVSLAVTGAAFGALEAVTMSSPAVAPAIPASTATSVAELTPGSLVAGRYRIVALLGRGGMGEVYRADDLKLGQAVALKFLPRVVEGDPSRLERFLNEVRTARQVSHPNVCRVHDVGETGGRHFISMEYVDGEDLASLLRRIGRLPSDKALEIARQLCAGLAAAHDRGVLHRDLKPANVMLDGRGHVRLTDFGLAESEGTAGSTALAGTPAYMAPEQFEGQPASVLTDIYALGLVLYEIFTGKRVFDAATIADLRRLHDESRPPSLATVIRDGDPAVERVIHRCLEKDPKQRPASAIAVAAALPGGDPLAAALAAGETPSPAMVAAAGESGGLRPGVAAAWFAAIVVGLLGVAYLASRTSALESVPKPFSQDVLIVKAEEILARLGYATPHVDAASAFEWDRDYLRYALQQPQLNTSASTRRAAVRFWYRTSPAYLAVQTYDIDSLSATSRVQWSEPARDLAGMRSLMLDPLGRLVALEVVPPPIEKEADAAMPPAVDWHAALAETGIQMDSLSPSTPTWTPSRWADTRAAWTGRYADLPGVPVRVEAAAYRGKLTYLQVVAPWTRSDRVASEAPTYADELQQGVQLFIVVVLLGGGALIARRNVVLGRGDRQGASRLAAATALVVALRWLLSLHFVPEMNQMLLLFKGLGATCFMAAWMWLLYVGLEPFVRRRWPHTLIGWSRLLMGRFTDPLVGRDVLAGASGGLVLAALAMLTTLALNTSGRASGLAHLPSLWALAGTRDILGFFGFCVFQAVLNALGLLFLLFMFRLVLRRDWLMALGFVVLLSTRIAGNDPTGVAINFAFQAAWALVIVAILTRFGLLAFAVAWAFERVLEMTPLTTDLSAWHAGPTVAGLVVLIALAAVAVKVALAGKSMLGVGLEGE